MTKRAGFTLVELVVVILILGILAGVAAPKMLNTSAKATDNGLRQSLAIIRDAIELYSAQNAGALPPCTGSGSDFKTALIPFVRGAFPSCPVGPAKNANVIPGAGGGAATPTDGWKFNTSTGAFICNYAAPSASDALVNYDTF